MFGPYGSSEQAHDYDISYRRSFDLFSIFVVFVIVV
jgi:hypothetical protein